MLFNAYFYNTVALMVSELFTNVHFGKYAFAKMPITFVIADVERREKDCRHHKASTYTTVPARYLKNPCVNA